METLRSLRFENPLLVAAAVTVALFSITSTTDVVTTYVGLTSGLSEQTAFVDSLYQQFGLIGLVASKIIAAAALAGASLIPLALSKVVDAPGEKLTLASLSITCLMAAAVYGYATLNNIALLT